MKDGLLESTSRDELKLIALDTEDLAVMSANLQDAIVRVADMAYLPRTRRFAMVVSRFDWAAAVAGRCERCRTGLHFERVLKVSCSGIRQNERNVVLNLLSVHFDLGDPPSGSIVLTFSGGAALRLDVECVEAQLRDIGPRWSTKHRPGHPLDDQPEGEQQLQTR